MEARPRRSGWTVSAYVADPAGGSARVEATVHGTRADAERVAEEMAREAGRATHEAGERVRDE